MAEGFESFDFGAMPWTDAYKLMASTIMPRPIAWVVSQDAAGVVNAAPFSFFNAMSADPPLVVLGFSGTRDRDGGKDSLVNIEATKEFVVNMVSEDLGEAMNITATNAPRGVDETQIAGLDMAPSVAIKVPRIAASPVAFECVLHQLVPTGGSATIVLGRIVYAHVKTEAFADTSKLYLDPDKLRLIGRMHGSGGYCTTRDTFVIDRKTWPLEK